MIVPPLSKATFIRASSDLLLDDFTQVPRTHVQASSISDWLNYFVRPPAPVRPVRMTGLGSGVGGALWEKSLASHGHEASTWAPLSPPRPSIRSFPPARTLKKKIHLHIISPRVARTATKSLVAPFPCLPDQPRASVSKSLNVGRGKKLEDLCTPPTPQAQRSPKTTNT